MSSPHRRVLPFLWPVGLFGLLLGPALSALEAPSIEALRIDEPIQLDGVLDEATWQDAEAGNDFRQRQPEEFEPATEPTTIRVVYTADTLYIGVHAVDSEPDKVVGREMGRDVPIFNDDGIVILLDTFLDRRNAYFFETNPNSSRTDGYVTDEGRDFSIDWDGVWNVKSRRTHDGWTAEFAIPFRTLRFDPAQDTWGLQVRRIIKRKSEIDFWSPIGRDAGLFRLSQAGTLTGLRDLETGRNLRLKPYVTASHREDRAADSSTSGGDSSGDEDAGLDLKWGITQGLALDVTLNTDFAETEVDEQQVNLTRFSLFFPEKREFFLENAGIFEFGPDLGPLLKVFFSRRIGLDAGRQVDLETGVRLAGRQGPWSIGLLGARTGSLPADDGLGFDAVPETEWGTVRLKRNVGERSNLGIIATHRNAGGGDDNLVYGIDGEWKPTDRLGFWAFGTASAGPGNESDGWAGGIGGSYGGSYWSGSARLVEIEDSFDPQLGFTLRPGRRNLSADVEWEPRPDWEGVRNLSFELEVDVFTKDGKQETSMVALDLFGIDFDSGESLVSWATLSEERLFEPFEIYPGVVLAADSYEWYEIGIWGQTNAGRAWSVEGWAETGEFYSGDRFAHSLSLKWRPNRFFRARLDWRRNDIDLPEGDFVTNLWRSRIGVSITPDLTVDTLLQYNDAAEDVSVNLRFNWHYRPGSDLFVVYNHGWDAPGLGDLMDRERQVIVKASFAWDV